MMPSRESWNETVASGALMRETRRILLLLLILVQPAEGQQAGILTVELVDQRIASLQAGGAVESNEALATYKQVKTLLNQADSHTRDAAAYVEALASSPRREAEIQQRLDELDETYEPGREVAGFTAEELTARLALARAEQRDARGQFESLDRRLAARETNASGTRARLAEIRQQAATLPDEVLTVSPSALPCLLEANQWLNAAAGVALSAEERSKEAQLASQPMP